MSQFLASHSPLRHGQGVGRSFSRVLGGSTVLCSWASARTRVRALLLSAVVIGPWLVPGSPPGPARAAAPAVSAANPCGDSWGQATKIGDLPGNLLEISGFASS